MTNGNVGQVPPAHVWFLRAPTVAQSCRYAVLVVVVALSPYSSGSIEAEPLGEAKRPFQVGERLTYEVSWLNLTAAIAVMEVARMDGPKDQALAKLVGTAQSTPMITKFFPVDNRVESELDLDTLTPEHMTFRRREGKKKEDIEYVFHQKEGRVTAV
jgi:hypothetical protein